MALPTAAGKSLPQMGNAVTQKQSPVTLITIVACVSAVVLGLITVIAGGFLAALLAIFLVFVAATLFNFRIGVLAAMVLLPLSVTRLVPREILGIKGLNPLNGVLAMTTLAVILLCAFFPKKLLIPRWGKMTWMYIGLITVWGLYGATHVANIPPIYEALKIISFDSAGGYLRDVLLKPLIILMISYMLGLAVANAHRPEKYLVPLFATSVVLPSVVVGSIVFGGVTLSMLAAPNSRGFLSFLGVHANELGLMFNMSFALALFSTFSVISRTARLSLIAVAAFLAAAVVLTFSRGAFLGILAVCAYLLIKQRRFTVIACAVLVLPFLALLIPDAVIERATTGVATGDITAISAGRVGSIWLPLLPEFFDHPIFGQGLSSVLWSTAARRGTMLAVGHPHSAYLGMVLDFGLLGVPFIIGFFVYLWRYFRDLAVTMKGTVWEGYFQGASACVLLLAVQGVTDDRVTPTLAQVFLWLSFGIGIGLRARLASKQQSITRQ
jgi:hypothetical protein